MKPPPPRSTLFPYTTLFRSSRARGLVNLRLVRRTGSIDSRIAHALALRAALMSLASQRLHSRSEEHTSELQSRGHLVCRLLLEKKNAAYLTHCAPILRFATT